MHRQTMQSLSGRAPALSNALAPRLILRSKHTSPRPSSVHWQQTVHQRLECVAAPGWRPIRHRQQHVAAIVCRSTLVPEAIPSDVKLELDPDTAAKEVTYDEPSKTIKIPLAAVNDGQRRTKMVMFTCNQCGGRSARLVNPVAWEKGAVFCQCQHCSVWHTLRAAKHIIEEIRYNEPDWQLEEAQLGQPAHAAAAQSDGSEGSSQTELKLPSGGDSQEVTSPTGLPQQQQRQ